VDLASRTKLQKRFENVKVDLSLLWRWGIVTHIQTKRESPMNEIEKSYIAGLIDGEGTITLTRKNKDKFRCPVVSVTNTSYEIIALLQESLGGSVRRQKVYKNHYKQAWIWSVSYDQAINAISIIQPYLKIPEKRRRCDLILNEYKQVTKRNGRYSPEDLKRKLDFEERFFM
jgi:intein/homing endonuclease